MFHIFSLLHSPVYRALSPSLSASKKTSGHITNVNIWSYNLTFSEKPVLYFHFTAPYFVQGAREKLKIASFIGHASRIRIHNTVINIPYYALKFSKEKCFIPPFLLCLYCIVLCAGCATNEALNHIHIARLRIN